MTTLTLNIDSGNAAFATDDIAREECKRLLRLVGAQVAGGFTSGILYDFNGNRCGSWDYEAPEPEDDEPEDDQRCEACGYAIDGRSHDGKCADCADDDSDNE